MKNFSAVLMLLFFCFSAGCSGDKYREVKECFADMKASQTVFMDRITAADSGQDAADAFKDNLTRSVKQIERMKELNEKFPELGLLADEPAAEWVRAEYEALRKHTDELGAKAASVMLKFIDDPAVTEIFSSIIQSGTEEQKQDVPGQN